ncbi:hypothetical protein ACFSCW_05975 [Sphingomonas tabacisoli]|uniref:Uncharacterized protein n=1 Tax=Sphingomonas tabacisoli TaxID=2249466 RepID=A0ABW4I1K5_9SPHN
MSLLLGVALSLAAPVVGTPAAPAEDWWWVAGDSRDEAAVFVDGGSVHRTGKDASVTAIRVARDGTPSDFSWRGRCGDHHADDEIAAVARFACGTDDDHMKDAALLGGLSPAEAAHAIFSIRNVRPQTFSPASARTVS